MAFKVFKRRTSSYQTWLEDRDGSEDYDRNIDDVSCPSSKIPTIAEDTDSPTTYGSLGTEERVLLECFYLGSFNMSGKRVTGRGCIDEPGAEIWCQTQEDCKTSKRNSRKTSLPLNLIECKPKYIRLAIGKDYLKVVDQYSEQSLMSFSLRSISFTGTHPKYSRMFCFIAWEPKNKIPFCHAFKCEDCLSAKAGALNLSNVFKKKCKEMMSQSATAVTSSPRSLRKAKSLQLR